MDMKYLLVNGEWIAGKGAPFAVYDKYGLKPGAHVTSADREQALHAVATAHAAFRSGAPVPHERGAILERAAGLIESRMDDFVRTMQMEAGFTASDAAGEVRRCKETLRLSAEEARRLAGDVIPLAGAPQQSGRLGYYAFTPHAGSGLMREGLTLAHQAAARVRGERVEIGRASCRERVCDSV